MDTSKRTKWIDAAKGMGIILVVLAHSGIPRELEVYLFAFHVPVFFVLAGVVFKPNKTESIKKFALQNAKRLLIPYLLVGLLSWCIQVLIYNPLLFNGELYDPIAALIGILPGTVKGDFLQVNAALWFLPALFFARIIYFAIRTKIKTRAQQLIVLFGLATVGFGLALSGLVVPFSLDAALIALLFIGAGEFYKRHTQVPAFSAFAIIPAFVLVYLLMLVQDKPDMSHGIYLNVAVFVVAALLGSFALIRLARLVKPDPIVLELGKHSLYYFALHLQLLPIATEVAGIIVTPFQHLLTLWGTKLTKGIVVTVATLLILFAVKHFVKLVRSKFNNHIFFG